MEKEQSKSQDDSTLHSLIEKLSQLTIDEEHHPQASRDDHNGGKGKLNQVDSVSFQSPLRPSPSSSSSLETRSTPESTGQFGDPSRYRGGKTGEAEKAQSVFGSTMRLLSAMITIMIVATVFMLLFVMALFGFSLSHLRLQPRFQPLHPWLSQVVVLLSLIRPLGERGPPGPPIQAPPPNL